MNVDAASLLTRGGSHDMFEKGKIVREKICKVSAPRFESSLLGSVLMK